MVRRLAWPFLAAVFLLAAFSGEASASPGAYRVLIVYSDASAPTDLPAALMAQPDVASVESVSAETTTPSPSQLGGHDLIISMSHDDYADAAAYGNELADFVDAGGVVAQFAFDNWDDVSAGRFAAPQGRFAGGGYSPYTTGDNRDILTNLGSFDTASPFMAGVSALTTMDNTDVALAAGATRVARWADGREAIAVKGRVLASSAYLGDGSWTGDFAQLAMNAVRVLHPRVLTVTKAGSGAGTVTSSSGGINCGSLCSAGFTPGSQVTVSATPAPRSTFAGFSGSGCSGAGPCTLTMDDAKAVTATFNARPRGKARAGFVGRTVVINLHSGAGSARMRCANVAGDKCIIRLTLQARARSQPSAAAKKKRRIKIGTVKGTVAGHKSGRVRVKLTRSGLRRLRNAPGHKLVKVLAAGRSTNGIGQSVKVKPVALTLSGKGR